MVVLTLLLLVTIVLLDVGNKLPSVLVQSRDLMERDPVSMIDPP